MNINSLYLHPYDDEAKRFNQIANYLDEFSATIDKIQDVDLKEKSKFYISQIENFVLQSPEWMYYDGLPGINLGIFGSINSGWKEVLQVFVDNDDQDYIDGMGIRVKHVIQMPDSRKHLLLIRYDIQNSPDSYFSNWVDCGIFVFRVESERTYRDSILSHKDLISMRKSDRKYSPMILVGCLDGIDAANPRLKSYSDFKDVADQCGFDEYFEIRYGNGYNLFFLFEYCTLMASRCKQHGFIPSKVINAKLGVTSPQREPQALVNLRKKKAQKRKTSFLDNNDNFKFPLGTSIGKKFAKKRNSFAFFKTKKNIQKNVTMETSVSVSSIPSIIEENNTSTIESIDNISMQGFLYKGRNKKWVTITVDGKMFYHASKQDYEKGVPGKYIDLKNSSANPPIKRNQNGYVLPTAKNEKQKVNGDEEVRSIIINTHIGNCQRVTRVYKALTEEERDKWLTKMNDGIFYHYDKQTIIRKSNSILTEDSVDDFVEKIYLKPGNNICAECSAKHPGWVVYNFGILVCDRCSGGHRSLGVDISKVCSLKLDGLEKIRTQILEAFGNTLVNSVMEAKLNLTDDLKPTPDCISIDNWLHKKYVLRKYIPPLPLPQDDIQKQLIFSIQEFDWRYHLICIMNSSVSQLDLPYDEKDSRTALMIAARVSNIVAVQMLLWAGVNVTIRDNDGFNAYSFASINVKGEPLTEEMIEIQDLLKKFNTPVQMLCKVAD